MPASQTRLLLVDQGDETAKAGLPARLVAAGYRLTLVQWTRHVWQPELFERVILSRLTNWGYLADRLRAEHASDPFGGVLCYNEGALTAADTAARLLGLPRISRFDAESFRYKDRARVAWESHGLPIPRYRVLHTLADTHALATWRYPIVVKPAAMMGSKGVFRVDRPADLPHVFRLAAAADVDMPFDGELWSMSEAFNLPAVALAEEYVPGTEYSAEGVVIGGEYHLLGVVHKVLGEGTFEEVGHVFPDDDLGPPALARLVRMLRAAHTALGMANAVTHVEFRADGDRFVLMELNARLAGDHIPDLLADAAAGDLLTIAAHCACGRLRSGDLPRYVPGGSPERAGPVFAVAFLSAPSGEPTAGAPAARMPTLHPPELDDCVVTSVAQYLPPGAPMPESSAWQAPRIGHVRFTARDVKTAVRAITEIRRLGCLRW